MGGRQDSLAGGSYRGQYRLKALLILSLLEMDFFPMKSSLTLQRMTPPPHSSGSDTRDRVPDIRLQTKRLETARQAGSSQCETRAGPPMPRKGESTEEGRARGAPETQV